MKTEVIDGKKEKALRFGRICRAGFASEIALAKIHLQMPELIVAQEDNTEKYRRSENE